MLFIGNAITDRLQSVAAGPKSVISAPAARPCYPEEDMIPKSS